MNPPAAPRDKLGLALAGGGFRAALFHVGVLRQLADLDLLRGVEVISTVSGGTFVGLLYALLLKKKLEENAQLDQAQYQELVRELEKLLRQAIQQDLRNLLISKPFKLLRMMLSPYSLSERMAELYEEHLLRALVAKHFPGEKKQHLLQALDEISGNVLLSKDFPNNPEALFQALKKQCGPKLFNLVKAEVRQGRIPLISIKIRPGGRHIDELEFPDIESYNWEQLQKGGSPITKLVINATSLNTGARFLFTASEIGEWHYGYFRSKDSKKLATYKKALDNPNVVLNPLEFPDAYLAQQIHRAQLRDLLQWWQRTGKLLEKGNFTEVAWNLGSPQDQWPEPWSTLNSTWLAHFSPGAHDISGLGLYTLCRSEMGLLRLARETVGHLSQCPAGQTCSCGLHRDDHLHVLAGILGEECEKYLEHTGSWLNQLDKHHQSRHALYTLIEQLFLIRSAARASADLITDWASLTCAQALAASANFPPVFPPFPVDGFYDNNTVTSIGLTDGGVYDNLGIMGLINEDCNYIISSDTGGVFPFEAEPALGHLSMSVRITNILNALGVRQRRLELIERHIVSAGLGSLTCTEPAADQLRLLHAPRQLHGLAIFRIDSDLVLCQEAHQPQHRPLTAQHVAQIRTDLDGFSDQEMAVLTNYGYGTAGLYIKNWLDLQKESQNRKLPQHIKNRYAHTKYPYTQAAQSKWVDPLAAQSPQPLTRPDLAVEAMQVASFRLFRRLRIFFRTSRMPKFLLICALALLLFSLLPLVGDLDKPGLLPLTPIWRVPLKILTLAGLNVQPGLVVFLFLLASGIFSLGLSLFFNPRSSRPAPLWLEKIFIFTLCALYVLLWGCLAWAIWAGLDLVPGYIRSGFYFLTAIIVSSLFWFLFGSWLPNKLPWYKEKRLVYYILLTVVVFLVSGVIFWLNFRDLCLSQTLADGGRWLGALVLTLLGFPFLGALAVSGFARLLLWDGKKLRRRHRQVTR
jgi:predicted acylesterase/phospholipase RssA